MYYIVCVTTTMDIIIRSIHGSRVEIPSVISYHIIGYHDCGLIIVSLSNIIIMSRKLKSVY